MAVGITPKTYWNIVFCERAGDKKLKAQTTTPEEFIDMNYPAFLITNDNRESGELSWERYENGELVESVYAIEVRPLIFDTLLSEVDFNRMLRE